MSDGTTTFGKNLRRLRKERGWSLNKLAAEADTNKGYLSELERGTKGQPSIDFMVKLGAALRCSTSEFLREDEGDFLSEVERLARDIPDDRKPSVIAMLRGLADKAA